MNLAESLLALERRFWTEGPDFYRSHLDDECLIAFTEQAGVSSKDEIADTVQGRRFSDLSIEPKGLVEPTEHFAILTYEAKATRPDGEPYAALVSSGYVERDGAWKMAFHQQTPRAAQARRKSRARASAGKGSPSS
jgi:hypothetical protein